MEALYYTKYRVTTFRMEIESLSIGLTYISALIQYFSNRMVVCERIALSTYHAGSGKFDGMVVNN